MDFKGINTLSLLDFPNRVSAILYTDICNFHCEYCHNWNSLIAPTDNADYFFDDILAFLKKRMGILDGVVLSGGEPTLMPDLEDKIVKIRELGYEIKLDTNGANPKVVKDLVNKGLIDYIAMDIKSSFDDYYRFVNKNNLIKNVQETASFLIEDHVDYEFRMTLISEFHTEEKIRKIAQSFKGAKRLYLQQFKVSYGVPNKNLHPVDEGLANKFRDILLEVIPEVELRGY